MIKKAFALLAATALATLGSPGVASASHSWHGYHWARSSNPFTVKLGDNVTSVWQSHLRTTSSDWTKSRVLNTKIVNGQTSRQRCGPTHGRVEVCNYRYGSTGWLGIASVWVNGKHITQGTVKLNDTYFQTSKYNTSAWRNLVSCQEVGHTLGLAHQDENFNNKNLGTCMDYTSRPKSNQHSNRHDYSELAKIYSSHRDGGNAVGGTVVSAGPVGDTPSSWGREIDRSASGQSSLYVRDLGGGQQVFTFVTWA